MNTAFRFTSLLLIMLGAAALVWANSSNPPIGHTGAPGEPTCAAAGCHDQYPLNSGPGAAELPKWLFWTYPVGTCPDDTTVVPIMVRQPGATRWGFELTVATEAGASSGTLFLADSIRTALVQATRDYIFQTEAGTDAGTADSSPGWTASWVFDDAPYTGAIRAYLVGVAADNDGTPQGDYVYTDSAEFYIVILDFFCNPGDVNSSGAVTSADVIFLVNFIFKGGFKPAEGEIAGDINCSGSVTSADVIMLVNYLFKGGFPPCDACGACCQRDDGSWTCP